MIVRLKRDIYIPGTMQTRHLLLLAFLGIITVSCVDNPYDPESSASVEPISNIEFTYLQHDSAIFVAADLRASYQSASLIKAQMLWYGKEGFDQVTPDSVLLYDTGVQGDILSGDGRYSRQVTLSNLGNTLVYEDTSSVYLKVTAEYSNLTTAVEVDTFNLGNIIPKFLWIEAPDTLVLPDSGYAIVVDVRAKVKDADGLEDIRFVGFTSRHVEPDTMLLGGNYVELYDDGIEDHGDIAAADSVYSVRIQFPYYAKTGEIEWRFRVQDWSNDFSETNHIVLVIP